MPVDIPADGDFGAAFGAARLGLDRRREGRPVRGLHRARRPTRRIEPDARRSLRRLFAKPIERYRALYPAIRGVSRNEPPDFSATSRRSNMKGRTAPIRWPTASTTRTRSLLGKRMEDHLRFAVAYWHTFAWPGGDPFGGQTFERPWFGDTMEAREAQGRRRLRDVLAARRALLLLPRRRRAPRRQDLRRERGEPRRDRRLSSPRSRQRPASSCSGARRTSSPTAASWRVPRPIPIRTSSPMPRRR